MAEGILLKSGGGGVGSDELTALAQCVLESMLYVGADTNDESGVGTMKDYSGTEQSASASLDATNKLVEMLIPKDGFYDDEAKLTVAYSTLATLIGLVASKVATGNTILGVAGSYKGLGDAIVSDVVAGKKFSTASLSNAEGTLADKSNTVQSASAELDTTNSRVQLKVPATGKYDTASKLYVAYATLASLISLTAGKIATGNTILGIAGTYKGLGDATVGDVVSGKKFSTASLSNASGTLANNSGTTKSATADLDTTNKRVRLAVPATAKYDTDAKLYVDYATLATLLGVEAGKMLTTETILGIQGTIASLAGGTYSCSKTARTISCKGKYMTSDIVINASNVQSALNFSATPGDAPSITFSWKNPATGPFSGVIIVGKTGSYPTSRTDGTEFYKGIGNNSNAGGTSSVTKSNFTGGTTYYFRCFSYALFDNAEWLASSSLTATATTKKIQGSQTFKGSTTWTVPAGVTSVDVFLVGGGASGATANVTNIMSSSALGGGGGGGYTETYKGVPVTPGQQIQVLIGAGGIAATTSSNASKLCVAGGETSFGSYKASGGSANTSTSYGSDGGSGGGAGYRGSAYFRGGNGGSNGSDGNRAYYRNDDADNPDSTIKYYGTAGKGQGSTTQAFGESSGTKFSGGGGGAVYEYLSGRRGYGGDSGGGTSGYKYRSYVASSDDEDDEFIQVKATSGTANSGGGGGGGRTSASNDGLNTGGNGGSGICIVRWGY